jgi:hypothetical protein
MMAGANVKLVRSFLHQKPFRPFRIVMRSGKRHDITDPMKVAVGNSSVYVHVSTMAELRETEIDLVYEPRYQRLTGLKN